MFLSLARLCLLLSIPLVTIASASPRLYDLGRGEVRWMDEPELYTYIQEQETARGRCGGFMDITDDPQSSRDPLYRISSTFYASRTIRQSSIIRPLFPLFTVESFRKNIEKLSSYKNRFYKSETGREAALWIRDEFARLSKGRTDIEIQLFNHANFSQPSVIATIRGQGPHANEHVVIGGHEDSISWAGNNGTSLPINSTAPGADDNASGVSSVLEIFRVVVEAGLVNDRTIDFITYAGEEMGLLGSQEIARSFQQRAVPVMGAMQLDMTAYPGSARQITLVSDFIDQDLVHFTEKLIDTYLGVPWIEEACGYGCSDHASWSRNGFASTFPFEAPVHAYNPKIHTPDDQLKLLDMDFGLHFLKLGLAFLVESAND